MDAIRGTWKARVGGRVLEGLVRALGATCRQRLLDERTLERLIASGEPAILAGWHEGLFLMAASFPRAFLRRGLPLVVLISRSRDGDLGAAMAERLGARVVRGSTSRGGGPALRRLVREVEQGLWPVVVPDGPRGPERQAKPGALALARLTGAPIVPVGVAVDRGWRLGSWDRTWIPKPGARLVVALGEPLFVQKGDEPVQEVQLSEHLDRAWQRARSAVAAGR